MTFSRHRTARLPYSVKALLALMMTLACSSAAHAQQAFFMGLGYLPGFDSHSFADDVSGDGSIVVGNSYNESANQRELFRWTRGTGMVELGRIVNNLARLEISDDGSTIAWNSKPDRESLFFRWRESTGIVPIATTYSDDLAGISSDGSKIAMTFHVWSEAGGLVDTLTRDNLHIHDISGDGLSYVGNYQSGGSGFISSEQEGITVLGPTLADGTIFYNPREISADGKVVVGYANTPSFSNSRLVRWQNETGMIDLGRITAGSTFSISADGSVFTVDHGSAIWRESRGLEPLEDVLANEFKLASQMAGWNAKSLIVRGMSNDGRTIVGAGINPVGKYEAWIAFLGTPVPEPNALIVAALALAPFAWRRRGVRTYSCPRTAKVRFSALAMALVAVLAAAPARAEQLFELHANDAAPQDYFGWSVAIDGNRAVIGAQAADKNNDIYDSGAAYVFDVNSGQLLHKLVASNAGKAHNFGTAVALHGDRALIGAARSNEDQAQYSGSAYLFDLTSGQQLRELVADGPAFLGFGRSVALTENFAVVGSDPAQVSSTPEAYVFNNTTGTQLRILTALDVVPNDKFATAMAIEGNLALIGAWGKDNDAGAAYLFDLSTGQQLYKLTAADAAANNRFGRSLALSGNLALIGAELGNYGKGAAYVFDVTTGQQLRRLTADDGNHIGSSVALSGSMALIGDHDNGYTGSVHGPGAAYVFDALTGQQLTKLTASDGASNDGFGYSAAIDGVSVIVGALATDDAGDRSGSAYLFNVAVPEPSALLLGALALATLTSRRRKVFRARTMRTPGRPLDAS